MTIELQRLSTFVAQLATSGMAQAKIAEIGYDFALKLCRENAHPRGFETVLSTTQDTDLMEKAAVMIAKVAGSLKMGIR